MLGFVMACFVTDLQMLCVYAVQTRKSIDKPNQKTKFGKKYMMAKNIPIPAKIVHSL